MGRGVYIVKFGDCEGRQLGDAQQNKGEFPPGRPIRPLHCLPSVVARRALAFKGTSRRVAEKQLPLPIHHHNSTEFSVVVAAIQEARHVLCRRAIPGRRAIAHRALAIARPSTRPSPSLSSPAPEKLCSAHTHERAHQHFISATPLPSGERERGGILPPSCCLNTEQQIWGTPEQAGKRGRAARGASAQRDDGRRQPLPPADVQDVQRPHPR